MRAVDEQHTLAFDMADGGDRGLEGESDRQEPQGVSTNAVVSQRQHFNLISSVQALAAPTLGTQNCSDNVSSTEAERLQ